jgi:hypothetical protein
VQEVANIRWCATKGAWRVQVQVDHVRHNKYRATHADAVQLLRELTGVEPPAKDRVPENVAQEVANIQWCATKHAWRVHAKVDGVCHNKYRATHADAVQLLRELTGLREEAASSGSCCSW